MREPAPDDRLLKNGGITDAAAMSAYRGAASELPRRLRRRCGLGEALTTRPARAAPTPTPAESWPTGCATRLVGGRRVSSNMSLRSGGRAWPRAATRLGLLPSSAPAAVAAVLANTNTRPPPSSPPPLFFSLTAAVVMARLLAGPRPGAVSAATWQCSKPDGLPSPSVAQPFMSGGSGPVDLVIGPGGDLFYAGFDGGDVRRISYPITAPSRRGGGKVTLLAARTRWLAVAADEHPVDLVLQRAPASSPLPGRSDEPGVAAASRSMRCIARLAGDAARCAERAGRVLACWIV